MRKRARIIGIIIVLLPTLVREGFLVYQSLPTSRVNCQVWSENSPYGQRTEFKVNWDPAHVPQNEEELMNCWLYEVEEVTVTAPDNSVHRLNKDFNINSYSGEVTQRCVIYGAEGLNLPPTGEYVFSFFQDGEIILQKTVNNVQETIGYPTNVQMGQQESTLYVNWTAPSEVDESMWYKVIGNGQYNNEYVFFSLIFEWNVSEAFVPNMPCIAGGEYQVNVALFFESGYAFSEYINFTWV